MSGQDRTQLFGILGIVLGICLCGPAGIILGILSIRDANAAGKPKTLGYLAIAAGVIGIVISIVSIASINR